MKNSISSENKLNQKLLKEIDLEDANRELAEREFQEYITYTFPRYEWSWHLKDLSWLLQGFVSGQDNAVTEEYGIKEINKFDVLCLDLPPRHGKSEQATIRLPTWYLGKYPEKEVISASYSSDLAIEFGTKARDLMNSDEYKNVFDIRLSQDTKAKDRWNIVTEEDGKQRMTGGGYSATGTGGSITGKGADLFIVDDPFKDRAEVEVKANRDKVWGWYQSVAQTRMSPTGKKIVIHTRWHDDDLIGRIKKLEKEDPESDRVLHISFPAIAKKNELRREIGQALWEARWPLPRLLKKKANIGSREFSALYQADPVDDETATFKRKDFRYIQEAEVEKKKTLRFLTVDSAITKKEDSAYTGFVDNRVDPDNFWNIAAWRKRMSGKELLDELFILQDLNGYDEIGVEETLFTIALSEFYEIEMRRKNKFLPLTYISHKNVNKDIRVRGVAPRYESHSVRHIQGRCDDLEEELVRFPSAEYRDLSDALAHQKDFAYPPDSEATEKRVAREDRKVKDEFGLFPEIDPGEAEEDDLFGIHY